MTSERSPAPTYSLLRPAARPPSEYDIVTSRLLYYVGRGFEVDVPMRRWYQAHQVDSPLQCLDWDAFRDPRETTYTLYTRTMQESESDLTASAARAQLAEESPPSDLHELLASLLGPARHWVHGLHMVAAYVGHMAPSGRIVLCAAFQAADELRRIEHLARRLAQLVPPAEAMTRGRALWEDAPRWQPARKTVEQLLVTYDWGESFAALCLCVKPVLDAALHRELRRAAETTGDATLAAAVGAFERASEWHSAWAEALAREAIAQNPTNLNVLQRWIDVWHPRAAQAARALATGDCDAIELEHAKRLAALGLSAARGEAER